MNRTLGTGIALSLLGLVAYAAGVWTPYPGRAFSVTAVMVGLTLVAIGRTGDPDGDGNGDDEAVHGGGDGTATENRGGAP